MEQVSLAVPQISGVSSANYQTGESLANDLLGLMGEVSKTVQATQTASLEGAKRVASDKNVELAKYIAEVRGNINYDDPTSLSDAQRAISFKQAELSDVKFDNEDSQRVFDDIYTKPTIVSVGNFNAGLKTKELVKLDDINYEDIKLKAELRYANNTYLSTDEIKAQVSNATAYKRFDKDDVEYNLASKNTLAFKSKLDTGATAILNSVGFDMAKGWDSNTKRKLFNREFGAWGIMQKDGTIKWDETFDEKAKSEILSAWLPFDNRMIRLTKKGKTKDPFNEKFFLAKNSATKQISQASNSYISSEAIQADIDSAELNFQKASAFFPLTDSQKKDKKITIATLKNLLDDTKRLEQAVNGSNDSVRSLIENGGDTSEVYDNITGGKRTFKIKSKDAKRLVKSVLDTQSVNALKIDVTKDEDSKQAFYTQLKKVKRLEDLSGMTSAITKKYNHTFDSGHIVQPFTVKEIMQSLAYENYQASFDSSKQNKRYAYKNLIESIQKIKHDDPDYNAKVIRSYQTVTADEKYSRNQELKSKGLNSLVDTYITEVEEIGNDATITDGFKTALKNYMVNNPKAPDKTMEEFKGYFKNQTFDYGSTVFGGKDYRGLTPFGLTETLVQNAINTIRKNYNKKHHTDLEPEDIYPKSVYDAETKNFKVIIALKDNVSKDIGTVTANGAIPAIKTFEDGR